MYIIPFPFMRRLCLGDSTHSGWPHLPLRVPQSVDARGAKKSYSLGMQLLFPNQQQPEQREMPHPVNISVPFLQESMGLGDVVQNVTQAFGVKPCGGCQQRKEQLNRRIQFNPYRG